jgi:hypothetical protein
LGLSTTSTVVRKQDDIFLLQVRKVVGDERKELCNQM